MKKNIGFFLLLLLSACKVFTQNTNNAADFKHQQPQYGFIENKGQIHDQDYKANPDVKYLLCLGNGMNVQLKPNSFSYDTYRTEIKEKEKDALAVKMRPNDEPEKDITYYFHRIDVELLGANANPQIIAEEPSTDYLNYYNAVTPESGATFVRSYKKITYRDIYPGIDMIFEARAGKDKPVEYTFVVHQGADAELIKLHYNGAGQTQLTQNQIQVEVAHGKFSESIPASWLKETKAAINVQYKNIEKDIYGFTIPTFNNDQTLIIDPNPNLNWGTYYGSSSEDQGYNITCDGSGNVFVTGITYSNASIATSGAHQITLAGNSDAFVVKFNNSGIRLWGTYYGGSFEDIGQSIACDINENVIITGRTKSNIGIATSGAHQVSLSGDYDAFVVKFNSNGIRQWGTYFGGTKDDYGCGITCDRNENLVITGYTKSSSGIATSGAYQTNYDGLFTDAFVLKLSKYGVRNWSTYLGGGLHDSAKDIVCDQNGNIFVVGSTTSTTGIATTGAHQTSIINNDYEDAFMVKFNNLGNRLWGTYYGGNHFDFASGISIDSIGNLFLTGTTYSSSGIATSGSHQAAKDGAYDSYLVKFNSSGVRQWGTYYGGSSEDYGYGIVCDTSGNVFFTGKTISSTSIATPEAHQTALSGTGNDVFVVKFNSSGVRQWGTYYGGNSDDSGNDVSSDRDGNIFITGVTESVNGIATNGAHDVSHGGSKDTFIARFSTCDDFPANAGNISGITTICHGQNSATYTVPAISNATSYIWTLPSGATGTSSTNSITVYFGASAAPGNISVKGHNSCGDGIPSSLYINFCCKNCPDSILTSTSGNFTYGCTNAPYNNSSHCKWLIFPSGASAIYISFPEFDILPGDKVRIWQGPDTTGILKGTFDNDNPPPTSVTTTVPMLVELITNAADVADGFKANFWTDVDNAVQEINDFITDIVIYPNPATNNINIKLPQKAMIEIHNVNGQCIRTYYADKDKVTIDISGLSQGLYFIKVISEQINAVAKFVKN